MICPSKVLAIFAIISGIIVLALSGDPAYADQKAVVEDYIQPLDLPPPHPSK
jgi:hypothetical protein